MRIVLLDLEETVIDTWQDRNAKVENLEKINLFLRKGDRLGLMSWAIWDGEDKHKFIDQLMPAIEGAVDHKFDPAFLFSMMDFSDIILRHCHKWLSRDDMFDIFGKEECLLKLLRIGWFPKDVTEIILIDDVVDHNLTFTLKGVTVRFINVEVFQDLW